MIKEAMEFLIGLKRPELVTVDERTYSTLKLEPVKDPMPETLDVHTLSSLVEYVGLNEGDLKTRIIHIVDHRTVSIISPIVGPFYQRIVFVTAKAKTKPFPFAQWMDPETFVIALQSQFVDSGDRAKILSLTGNMSEGGVTDYNDDGITQAVSVKHGISMKDTAAVPNPVTLAPYCSFIEIEQPERRFVLRVKKSGTVAQQPMVALFEADGGAWEMTAIKRIGDYLADHITDENITIMA